MIDSAPLRHSDLFHTGIVVDDLSAAKDEFGRMLGLTWLEGGAEVRLLAGGRSQVVTTAYAMSAEGPHHIELVQSIPGTLYERVGGLGDAHHIGYWADDVLSASARLSASGLARAAAFSIRDDRPPLCVYHHAGPGCYIELVDRAFRPVLLGIRD